MKLVQKIRAMLGPSLNSFLNQRALIQIQKRTELWNVLQAVISPSTGCSFSDYWALYSYIKKNKPQEVLELGSGVSTLVIAQALFENGTGRVTSMEESLEYRDATDKTIPDSLRPYIDLTVSHVMEYCWGPFAGTAYEKIPKRDYDFVFVDGPQYDAATSFDADLLRLITESSKPVSAFIDMRTGTSLIYHFLLGKKFSYNYIEHRGFVNRVTKADVSTYSKLVASHMKRHAFRRSFR